MILHQPGRQTFTALCLVRCDSGMSQWHGTVELKGAEDGEIPQGGCEVAATPAEWFPLSFLFTQYDRKNHFT